MLIILAFLGCLLGCAIGAWLASWAEQGRTSFRFGVFIFGMGLVIVGGVGAVVLGLRTLAVLYNL